MLENGASFYGSQMSANFYSAILGFVCALCTTLLLGYLRPAAHWDESSAVRPPLRFSPPVVILALGIAAVCVALNVVFR